MPAVIENRTFPIRMKSLPWIRVLIKMSTIKEAKTMVIAWKVRGYLVQDHANAILVKNIDQEGKIGWPSIATGWSKETRTLITP